MIIGHVGVCKQCRAFDLFIRCLDHLPVHNPYIAYRAKPRSARLKTTDGEWHVFTSVEELNRHVMRSIGIDVLHDLAHDPTLRFYIPIANTDLSFFEEEKRTLYFRFSGSGRVHERDTQMLLLYETMRVFGLHGAYELVSAGFDKTYAISYAEDQGNGVFFQPQKVVGHVYKRFAIDLVQEMRICALPGMKVLRSWAPSTWFVDDSDEFEREQLEYVNRRCRETILSLPVDVENVDTSNVVQRIDEYFSCSNVE